jgi:Transposase and inactivated derivatives
MTRRKFTAKFKKDVVIEALRERITTNELAQKHGVSPQQISTWKREFLNNAEQVFGGKKKTKKDEAEQEKEALLKIIGQQKVDIDFLKKALM